MKSESFNESELSSGHKLTDIQSLPQVQSWSDQRTAILTRNASEQIDSSVTKPVVEHLDDSTAPESEYNNTNDDSTITSQGLSTPPREAVPHPPTPTGIEVRTSNDSSSDCQGELEKVADENTAEETKLSPDPSSENAEEQSVTDVGSGKEEAYGKISEENSEQITRNHQRLLPTESRSNVTPIVAVLEANSSNDSGDEKSSVVKARIAAIEKKFSNDSNDGSRRNRLSSVNIKSSISRASPSEKKAEGTTAHKKEHSIMDPSEPCRGESSQSVEEVRKNSETEGSESIRPRDLVKNLEQNDKNDEADTVAVKAPRRRDDVFKSFHDKQGNEPFVERDYLRNEAPKPQDGRRKPSTKFLEAAMLVEASLTNGVANTKANVLSESRTGSVPRTTKNACPRPAIDTRSRSSTDILLTAVEVSLEESNLCGTCQDLDEPNLKNVLDMPVDERATKATTVDCSTLFQNTKVELTDSQFPFFSGNLIGVTELLNQVNARMQVACRDICLEPSIERTVSMDRVERARSEDIDVKCHTQADPLESVSSAFRRDMQQPADVDVVVVAPPAIKQSPRSSRGMSTIESVNSETGSIHMLAEEDSAADFHSMGRMSTFTKENVSMNSVEESVPMTKKTSIIGDKLDTIESESSIENRKNTISGAVERARSLPVLKVAGLLSLRRASLDSSSKNAVEDCSSVSSEKSSTSQRSTSSRRSTKSKKSILSRIPVTRTDLTRTEEHAADSERTAPSSIEESVQYEPVSNEVADDISVEISIRQERKAEVEASTETRADDDHFEPKGDSFLQLNFGSHQSPQLTVVQKRAFEGPVDCDISVFSDDASSLVSSREVIRETSLKSGNSSADDIESSVFTQKSPAVQPLKEHTVVTAEGQLHETRPKETEREQQEGSEPIKVRSNLDRKGRKPLLSAAKGFKKLFSKRRGGKPPLPKPPVAKPGAREPKIEVGRCSLPIKGSKNSDEVEAIEQLPIGTAQTMSRGLPVSMADEQTLETEELSMSFPQPRIGCPPDVDPLPEHEDGMLLRECPPAVLLDLAEEASRTLGEEASAVKPLEGHLHAGGPTSTIVAEILHDTLSVEMKHAPSEVVLPLTGTMDGDFCSIHSDPALDAESSSPLPTLLHHSTSSLSECPGPEIVDDSDQIEVAKTAEALLPNLPQTKCPDETVAVNTEKDLEHVCCKESSTHKRKQSGQNQLSRLFSRKGRYRQHQADFKAADTHPLSRKWKRKKSPKMPKNDKKSLGVESHTKKGNRKATETLRPGASVDTTTIDSSNTPGPVDSREAALLIDTTSCESLSMTRVGDEKHCSPFAEEKKDCDEDYSSKSQPESDYDALARSTSANASQNAKQGFDESQGVIQQDSVAAMLEDTGNLQTRIGFASVDHKHDGEFGAIPELAAMVGGLTHDVARESSLFEMFTQGLLCCSGPTDDS